MRRLVNLLPFRLWRGKASRSDEGERQSRFLIEPLEPRILLSGDPVASELARLVDDAAHATFIEDHAAIVESVAADAVTDANHADRDAQAGAKVANTTAGDERGVQWPGAWLASDASEQSATTGNADDKGASDLAALAAVQTAAVNHTLYLGTAYIYRETAYIETAPTAAIAVVAVAPSTSLSTSADGQPLVGQIDQEAPVSDTDLPRGPPNGGEPIRAPPVADYLLADASSPVASSAATVSASDLQSLADAALSIWSKTLADEGLALPAGSPTFGVADLADGILGSTDGSTIRIDNDAAGRG